MDKKFFIKSYKLVNQNNYNTDLGKTAVAKQKLCGYNLRLSFNKA